MVPGSTPLAAQSSRMPVITPREGSSGVVDTLWMASVPVAMSE